MSYPIKHNRETGAILCKLWVCCSEIVTPFGNPTLVQAVLAGHILLHNRYKCHYSQKRTNILVFVWNFRLLWHSEWAFGLQMCANVSETATLSSTGLLISCCREAVGGAQNPKDCWKKWQAVLLRLSCLDQCILILSKLRHLGSNVQIEYALPYTIGCILSASIGNV